ncbi:multidrug transporter [Erythrobacter sp. KY5]|uniref:efflux transporter outer membrane subunit n=1 Tax=Erythrobacter sp. KY5 TaxID=2011159 RepID=UPI000DBF133F|nr:TolC family protein [Erythrobacter sp. KY5]AWW72887.1 multidrug transporter [Erythrobacter sp. KY5]
MRPLSPRLLSLALAAPLAACVAGPAPEIATPTPELPSDFFYSPDAASQTTLASLLPSEDPAFAALSQAAVERAPSLGEALARVDAARAGARRAGAERLPNVGVDGNVTGNRINPAQFGADNPFAQAIDTEQLSYAANLTASWDADLFGRLRAQERAAIARIDSASASASAVRLALLAEIAGSVTDWRVLEARRQAIESDVEAATQLASLARTREDAGIAPGFDRVRAEAAASASRSRLAALESERVRIVGRLITLTGLSGSDVSAALALGGPELSPQTAPAALPSELLANRPDVVAAAAELAASDADLAAAARARFPRLSLSAVIGLLAFNAGDFFSEDSVVGTLTAGIAAPLLDFGRIEAEIDGAAANKRVAFQAYRGAVFQALGDAEAAYGLIAASDEEAALAVQERDELQRAANLANDRYRAGLASFLEVLEARRAADASGERAAAALGRAERARILLWQALGGERAGERAAES